MLHDEFRFEFCTPEEIDYRFEAVIKRCNGKKNYKEIEKIIRTILGNTILQITILEPGDEFSVYRVTRKYPEFKETDPGSYSFPPKEKTPLNRANIAGHPVLYTSFNVATAIRESIPRIDSDDWFFISEWSVKITEETYQYTLLINSETIEDKFLTTPLVKTLLEKIHTFFEQSPDYNQLGIRRLLIKYGDLFSFPGPEFYHISSAIAHHALYAAELAPVQVGQDYR